MTVHYATEDGRILGTVYLSGPIMGETYQDARFGWRKAFADLLGRNIRVLSPMRHEGHLAEIQGTLDIVVGGAWRPSDNHIFSHPKMLVAKDFLDIERSDILVVGVLGAKAVSRGTLVELGYAKALGKTILLVMEPHGNVHEHPFVTEVADVVTTSYEEAAMIVNSLLSEGI